MKAPPRRLRPCRPRVASLWGACARCIPYDDRVPTLDEPSPFFRHHLDLALRLLSSRSPVGQTPPAIRGLDLAAGAGRHALAAAAHGVWMVAVDRDEARLAGCRAQARAAGLAVHAVAADLTCWPLPAERFDLVVCFSYLQRDLFPQIVRALRPGGVVMYETFTRDQLRHGFGPRNPDHLLVPNELLAAFRSLRVFEYRETLEPAATAAILAQKT